MRVTVALFMAVAAVTAIAEPITVPGVLRPAQVATLSAEQPGIVTQINYSLGQSVERGDTLARLDCRLFEGELSQSTAERRAVEVRLQGDRRLFELGSIGSETVALNEIELEKARATEGLAQLAVDRCRISAPFSGRVNQVAVRPFDAIQANQVLVELVSLDGAFIELVLPFPATVDLGDEVQVLDRAGNSNPAEIVALSPTVDPASQTRIAQAFIDQLPEGWAPGMAVQIQVTP